MSVSVSKAPYCVQLSSLEFETQFTPQGLGQQGTQPNLPNLASFCCCVRVFVCCSVVGCSMWYRGQHHCWRRVCSRILCGINQRLFGEGAWRGGTNPLLGGTVCSAAPQLLKTAHTTQQQGSAAISDCVTAHTSRRHCQLIRHFGFWSVKAPGCWQQQQQQPHNCNSVTHQLLWPAVFFKSSLSSSTAGQRQVDLPGLHQLHRLHPDHLSWFCHDALQQH